jgi:hypothetical protein
MDQLNFDDATIRRNRNGNLVLTGTFSESIPNLIADEMKRHTQAVISGIKVEIYKNGFQIFHLKDCDIEQIGTIIARLTRPKPSLLSRILMDLDDGERKLFGRTYP